MVDSTDIYMYFIILMKVFYGTALTFKKCIYYALIQFIMRWSNDFKIKFSYVVTTLPVFC